MACEIEVTLILRWQVDLDDVDAAEIVGDRRAEMFLAEALSSPLIGLDGEVYDVRVCPLNVAD
jgi:hypothetical protein